MHEIVSFNGEFCGPAEPEISALSTAALYGKGVFSTIRIRDGRTFLWNKHWRRLSGDAAKLGIDLRPFTEHAAIAALEMLIEKNKIADGRARVTFFDQSAGKLWPFRGVRGTSLLITTGDLSPRTSHLKLTVSPYALNSRSALAGVKSCSYAEKILAADEAARRGFDEAIQTNERGAVASGCMSNVFWKLNGELFTPALATGCLAGTTREFVMENLECIEIEASLETLRAADAVFLTSAGLGVKMVAEFDGRSMPEMSDPILDLIELG